MEIPEASPPIEEVPVEVAELNEFRQARNRLIRRGLGYAALGSAVLATATSYAWNRIETSGQWTHLAPTSDQPAPPIDNVERIISWNMHGIAAKRYKQIRNLARTYDADAVTLQEVDTDDVQRLHKHFPAWNIVYVLADKGQHFLEHGYGNVIMTRQDPHDISARSFPGTTMLASIARTGLGLGEDLGNLVTSTADAAAQTVATGGKASTSPDANFEATKDGRQERRAAVALTTQVLDTGKLIDLRLIDGHISGNASVHKRQLDEFVDFIKKNAQGNRPTIVCADFNGPASEITPLFKRIGFSVARKTGVSAGFNDDYCAYNQVGTLGIGQVNVLSKPHTDHFPLIATWELPAPPVI